MGLKRHLRVHPNFEQLLVTCIPLASSSNLARKISHELLLKVHLTLTTALALDGVPYRSQGLMGWMGGICDTRIGWKVPKSMTQFFEWLWDMIPFDFKNLKITISWNKIIKTLIKIDDTLTWNHTFLYFKGYRNRTYPTLTHPLIGRRFDPTEAIMWSWHTRAMAS